MVARFHYDRGTLQGWIDDASKDSTGEVASHVETCVTCQTALESLFNEGLSLEKAGELLRHPPVAKLAKSCDDDDPTVLAPFVATLLDPSEHPGSLGRFARYEIMELLGRGGMGIVMRGFDPALNRHSAVKVLAPELASSAAARRRFSREAKSAAAVIHPHVVPIQTVDEHNGLPYLVMPVVEGDSVQQRVERRGPLETIEVVRIAVQVARGLTAAHEQGLVHRDIKPANVLLENGVERVRITDFGLARAVDDASMTRSGVIAGTPQYMSPEQAHGDAIDHRSDLFSLGSLIYFMCSGRSPFRAETTVGVLNRIASDDPKPLRSVNADVPEWLEQIDLRLLAKDAGKRFQSATEVADYLEQWLVHLQTPESKTPPTMPDFHVGASVGDSRSRNENRSAHLGESNRPGRILFWLVSLATAGVLAVFGIVIAIETNKGTLRIDTSGDIDVPNIPLGLPSGLSAKSEEENSLDGTWQLIEVEQRGKPIDGNELIVWLESSPDFSQLIFCGNSMVVPFQRVPENVVDGKARTDAKTYELHIHTRTQPHRVIGSKGLVVLFNGIYKLSTDDDSTQLTIVLPESKGPPPNSFDTGAAKTLKLTYERVLGPAVEDDAANTNGQFPPRASTLCSSRTLERL